MPTKIKFLAVLALSAALSTPALSQEPSADTIVASVGDTDITLGQLIVLTTQLPQQYQQLDDGVLYEAVLEQMIRQVAVAKTADGNLSKAAQLAYENQRLSFLASEALSIVAEAAITDDTVQAAYDAQFQNAEKEQEFNASHILVATEEEAAAIKTQLDEGADFAELAKEKSTGPSGPGGGALGWFGKGMMVKPFEEAVLALEVGQVSDPIQTQFGWHVVLLNDARDVAVPPLDAVRAEIEDVLRQEAVQAEIDRILGETEVVRPETPIDPAALRNIELVRD